MDEQMLRQLKGAGQVALGTARVVSGVATATGHGLLGGFLRSHHMTAHAARLGSMSVKASVEQIQKGWEELNR
jgi:hypothetical protein